MIYDNYNIDEQYQEIRKLLQLVEVDIYKLIGSSKNNSAAIRARRNLNLIKNKIKPLRQDIQKQRQDNKSEY